MDHRKGKLKVIITVRLDLFNPKELNNFDTYKCNYGKCYNIYKLYSEKNSSSVFIIPEFLNYLQSGLMIKDELGAEKPIFQDKTQDWFSYKNVFSDDNFKKWIKQERNKVNLIKELVETKADFLVKKHKSHEIYILPVLNIGFDKQNIKYIETIIKSFEKKDEDLYLLLHDNDLYDVHIPNHPVSNNDTLGLKLEDNSKLKTLINDNKVFVFQHIDKDTFYTEIIQKLNDLSPIKIIKKLEEHAQIVLFGKKLSKCMRRSEMENVMRAEIENNKYDFSKPFLN